VPNVTLTRVAVPTRVGYGTYMPTPNSPRPRGSRRTPSPQEQVETALHTVLHEVGEGAHPDDLLDAVFGMVGQETYDAVGDVAIRALVRRFS